MDRDYQLIIDNLRKRADIREAIPHRRSVMEGKPDRLSALLREAADSIEELLDTSAKRVYNIEHEYKHIEP